MGSTTTPSNFNLVAWSSEEAAPISTTTLAAGFDLCDNWELSVDLQLNYWTDNFSWGNIFGVQERYWKFTVCD